MNESQFKLRTKTLAIQVIRLVETLPNGKAADVIGKQLLRSSSSVAANYRAACRGKSAADMISKLAIVEEEGDETLFWLEMLVESGLIPACRTVSLAQEANEIVAMIVSSIRTLRRSGGIQNPKSQIRNPKAIDKNHGIA